MRDRALSGYIAEKGDSMKKVEMIGHDHYFFISTREVTEKKTSVSVGYHTERFDTLRAFYEYLRDSDTDNGWRITNLSAI